MVDYILGVFFAIIGGMANFSGQILQKKAVNEIPEDKRNKHMMKILWKTPIWVFGFLLVVVVSAVFIMTAQGFIGPALVPGLTSSGLIVLAIGSVKVIGEKLKKNEMIAIILIIVAITFIGLSELSIEGDMSYFNDMMFTVRILLFSSIFLVLWIIFIIIGRKNERNKVIFLSLGAGFPFVLGNIWVQPLVISITSLITGNSGMITLLVFMISAAVLAISSFMGIAHLQEAFRAGNASLVVPIQQLPQQIGPVLIFYLVYILPPPSTFSIYFMVGGIILIVICGFILAKRQAAMEEIK